MTRRQTSQDDWENALGSAPQQLLDARRDAVIPLSPAAMRHARRGLRELRSRGPRSLVVKSLRVGLRRLTAEVPDLPLDLADVADSTQLNLELPSKVPPPDAQLRIGWICTPPALGSGGHTTMFRMIHALERAGHQCTIFLYDRHGGSPEDHGAVIRQGWPQVRSAVSNQNLSVASLDACVATSWETAHVLATHGTQAMRRLYFVQDYEPWFLPRGAEWELAADSYRFGFRCIALGEMVARHLTEQLGIRPDVAPFGCDTDTYHLAEPNAERSGVVFYAKPGNARRGYWLARLALTEFHRRNPDVPIRVYGADSPGLPFPAEVYPRLTPYELNTLYNRSVAGLALSFTNISLVAEELLAAGAIPVVNDSPDARADLVNPHVAWAFPTPAGVAGSLESIVRAPRIPERARLAAASVRHGWGPAQAKMVQIIEDEVYRHDRRRRSAHRPPVADELPR